MTSILYLVHDLSDAAVRKRCTMFKQGGANVTLAGFTRRSDVKEIVPGVETINLGLTRDGRFLDRIMKIVGLRSGKVFAGAKFDVIVARNLEMLLLAGLVAKKLGAPRIVYESLDIHRLLLRPDAIGKVIRALERKLVGNTSLIITSSPAFIENYFVGKQGFQTPIYLQENKVLELVEGVHPENAISAGTSTPPVVIGWFGILRCKKSLAILSAFSRKMEGRVSVVLRGKPAYTEMPDFDATVANEPYLTYEGPYQSPEDLSRIYGEVDLVWAIDFFEEGLNSKWLLPNRLYEGCRYGRVPIAVEDTETGRYLKHAGIGIVLPGSPEELQRSLTLAVNQSDLPSLAKAVQSRDLSLFRDDLAACHRLVKVVSG
jgi:hypothetical protein